MSERDLHFVIPTYRLRDVGATVEASWIVPGFRLDRIDPSGIYSSMALFDFDASGH